MLSAAALLLESLQLICARSYVPADICPPYLIFLKPLGFNDTGEGIFENVHVRHTSFSMVTFLSQCSCDFSYFSFWFRGQIFDSDCKAPGHYLLFIFYSRIIQCTDCLRSILFLNIAKSILQKKVVGA